MLTENVTFPSTHLHPAQPVSVPMPPGETSSATAVATNYETEMYIANAARGFCHAMNRTDHAGENKNARERTRLLATKRSSRCCRSRQFFPTKLPPEVPKGFLTALQLHARFWGNQLGISVG